MSWKYEYDEDADETTIYWEDAEQGSVDGQIKTWNAGCPLGNARGVVSDAIQSADKSERIKMQFDLHYGFQKINTDL